MSQRNAACGVVHSDPGRAGWCVGRRKAASEYKAPQPSSHSGEKAQVVQAALEDTASCHRLMMAPGQLDIDGPRSLWQGGAWGPGGGGGARDNIKSEQSNRDSFEEDLLDDDEDEDLVTATVTVGNGPGQLDRTTAATVLPAVAQQGDVYFY